MPYCEKRGKEGIIRDKGERGGISYVRRKGCEGFLKTEKIGDKGAGPKPRNSGCAAPQKNYAPGGTSPPVDRGQGKGYERNRTNESLGQRRSA